MRRCGHVSRRPAECPACREEFVGAPCRDIDHLGLAVVLPEHVYLRCVACDEGLLIKKEQISPRSMGRLPLSFQVGKLPHVHERVEVDAYFGQMNVCLHCQRALQAQTFSGGPETEGVIWRPSRCYANHHEFEIDFERGVEPDAKAECRNCGEPTTVAQAMGY
jgi:hypothetical protein